MHNVEPKGEVSNDDDDHDENSMGSKMESKTPPNLNPSSFLGMAAAGLMDPSAAKGILFNQPSRFNFISSDLYRILASFWA